MKRNYAFGFVIALIVLTGCPNSKSSTDAVELKMNLEKGKNYSYNTSTHFDMNMDVSGQKMATGLDMAYTFKLTLDHMDSAGNNILNSDIDAVKMKVDVMGMSMGYDSKEVIDTNHQDAMSGMLRKVFSGMIGKSFKLTINPLGGVEDVSGVEEMVTSMIEGMPGSEEEKAKMKQQLSQSFNKEQLRQTFAQAFNIYPGKPVKIGDTWNKEVDLGLKGMNNKQDIVYKVKDITSTSVILDMKGTIKASGNKTDSTKVPAAMDLSGSESGTMTIDRSSGMVNSGDIDINFKGIIDMKGTKMPMDMKGKIHITGK